MLDGWAAFCISLVSERYILPETAFYTLEHGHVPRGISTLTEADTRDMIAMKAQGMTYKEIGDLYGLDATAVFNRTKRRYRAEQKEKAAQ